jgi:hypothetical protein
LKYKNKFSWILFLGTLVSQKSYGIDGVFCTSQSVPRSTVKGHLEKDIESPIDQTRLDENMEDLQDACPPDSWEKILDA